MDKISSYFNDCFSDNYYVFVLTHKTNVNIDEETKHIETTKTIIFDQSIKEEPSTGKEEEDEKKDEKVSKIAVISKEATFVTHYITNLNVDLTAPKLSHGVVVYPLVDKRNKIYTERAFDDFFLLRRALAANFPACFIPVLPSKAFYVSPAHESIVGFRLRVRRRAEVQGIEGVLAADIRGFASDGIGYAK